MKNSIQHFMRWTIATPDRNHTFHLKEILLFCGFMVYWVFLTIWLYVKIS